MWHLFPIPGSKLGDPPELGEDVVIPLGIVGNQACRAVLDPIFGIAAIAAAAHTKGIKGTIAEKAVEILAVLHRMTGKIGTVPVLKKTIAVFHDSILSFHGDHSAA